MSNVSLSPTETITPGAEDYRVAIPSLGSLATGSRFEVVEFEITGRCQLQCTHCYAESGPQGDHGTMTDTDWRNTIDQLAELETKMVQFIGGEPLLHPSLGDLVGHALAKKIQTEVYSNLVHVRPKDWDMLTQEGVSLATSYYSPLPDQHEKITRRRGSHEKTRRNIMGALERGIPLRVGVIGVEASQQVEQAVKELEDLGVEGEHIGVDYLRQVGRGVREQNPGTEQLCGSCASGILAILSNGDVQPCVFARQGEFRIGNVQDDSLKTILKSDEAHAVTSRLDRDFAERMSKKPLCDPRCSPNCAPSAGKQCAPECMPNCLPKSGGRPIH